MGNNLSVALSESLSEEATLFTTGLLEVGLDAVMEDGILKEVPILSTAVGLYKIGHSLKERHYVKKLGSFVVALNNGIVDEEKREYYRNAMKNDPMQRDKEIEYILLLIDRYIHSDKAKMLAKLYLVFLDGGIDWNTFSKSSEILDRLLPGDYETLQIGDWPDVEDTSASDSLLRLVSLGLVVSHNRGTTMNNTVGTIIIPISTIKDYELTAFGEAFLRTLSG